MNRLGRASQPRRRIYTGRVGDCALLQWTSKTTIDIERFYAEVKGTGKIHNPYWSLRDEMLSLRSDEDYRDITRVHFPERQLKDAFQAITNAFFFEWPFEHASMWWAYGERNILREEDREKYENLYSSCRMVSTTISASGDPFEFRQKYMVLEPKPQVSTALDYVFSATDRPLHDLVYVIPFKQDQVRPCIYAVREEDMPVKKFYCYTSENEELCMSVRMPVFGCPIKSIGHIVAQNPGEIMANLHSALSRGSWFEVEEVEVEQHMEDDYDPRYDAIVDDRNDV